MKTLLRILAQTDVAPAFLVLKDVNAMNVRTERKLVAGVGFEPAVRRLPDYEPGFRLRPVIE
jgi:hypothetical protein